MQLSNVEIEILESVIVTFMDKNAPTKRKELVLKTRAPSTIDKLIHLQLLRVLDNDGNLAPRTYAIEQVGDAETKMRATAALEMVIHALQEIYAITPERKPIQRNDVLAKIIAMRGTDVAPRVVDRGLYFIQEFDVFDGYGPEPGPAREPLFNLHWMVISERVIALDPRTAWASHTRQGITNAEHSVPHTDVSRQDLFQSSIESDDYKFSQIAIAEARKSVSEKGGKPRPKVGAVVVKNRKIICAAHRGEILGNHAEFIALERKLPDEALAGATVYTTLEPCTTRNHPKVPCATRLAQRKVARVVIGMLDPDPRITGKGQRSLRKANIATVLFPPDLMAEVEEMNRDFTEFCERETLTDDGAMPVRLPSPTLSTIKALSLHTQLAEGKRWVEEILSSLLAERGFGLDSPINWTADEGREIYTLEASIKGLRKLWRLSYEALEDCVRDRNIQRTIRRSLSLYFVPDSPESRANGSYDALSEEEVVVALRKHQGNEKLDQLTLEILDREGYITTADVTNMDSHGRELLLISITPKGQRLLSRLT